MKEDAVNTGKQAEGAAASDVPARAASPMPFLEWRTQPAPDRDFQGELSELGNLEVARAEYYYHTGRFEEAVYAADRILEGEDEVSRLVALTLKMRALMAMGDSRGSFDTLIAAQSACNQAISHREDDRLFGSSVICAHILEGTVAVPSDRIPELAGSLDTLPTGIQVYSGFQMAAIAYARGELLRVLGMVGGFLAIAGDKYPIPCIKLNLLAAAVYLRLDDPDSAAESYRAAWAIAGGFDALAPFVEMNAYIPGLTRHVLKDVDENAYLRIRAMVNSHRLGWSGLRDLCGYPMPGRVLTNMEVSVSMLASWGWSNRRIATYLDVAETTVKHYLTSIYQKFGVASRAQLVEFLLGQPHTVKGLIKRDKL